MIISRTPFRISLFGGGTDFPKWYRAHGGAVIGGAIDKYCYISLRRLPPFFEYRHRIVYSNIEQVREVADIRHPAVRAVLGEMGMSEGLEIHHDGDLPARSGLGSSSSFTVGLLNALHAFHGRMVTKEQLAAEAIHIEQTVIGEAVGSQDQTWAAYGGLNRIDFNVDGSIDVTPLIMNRVRREALQSHLVLYFTGLSRYASDIEKDKIANLDACEAQLLDMRAMVDEAASILGDPRRDLADLGRLLHESWMLKRTLSPGVSNPAIDELYETALGAGALGGKLLGAGGGGFLLLFVPPERQDGLRKRLEAFTAVKFRFDNAGSKIVVYEPNDFER
ncbi:GHMP family kinase ATP-binding protein [Azospirillum isscasi]|uniref:Kinase n=1 Tax=Azospirillum isscasi TaxID=3053926 RepID=A0ABU0WML4_9PROT|nr:kinase [Azospirillum isscasi]MDQ2105445.1 kinase [Azospirillum isscasi]